MKIQLALDRMSIAEALAMARRVEAYVDWIEIGTSLIKEFGMRSVAEFRATFPDKVLLADMKTMDNAAYETNLWINAGADIGTVMAVAPAVTVTTCLRVAQSHGKQLMMDLLDAPVDKLESCVAMTGALLCLHAGKDQQESVDDFSHLFSHLGESSSFQPAGKLRIALAGGITTEILASVVSHFHPEVLIVGEAITKSANPEQAARQFRTLVHHVTGSDLI
ncbi:3-hexulose-6-phosphate synthase [Alicyclobacillaceae bacterium I2511]|nr:3-hexulose-6-phosphate synthase [Alicyclobacillaceae bacterium I2511]